MIWATCVFGQAVRTGRDCDRAALRGEIHHTVGKIFGKKLVFDLAFQQRPVRHNGDLVHGAVDDILRSGLGTGRRFKQRKRLIS